MLAFHTSFRNSSFYTYYIRYNVRALKYRISAGFVLLLLLWAFPDALLPVIDNEPAFFYVLFITSRGRCQVSVKSNLNRNRF